MEWILIVLLIAILWVLFDIANKLHSLERDVEIIRRELQRAKESGDD